MAERRSLTGDIELQLPEFENPPADPIQLFSQWLDSAVNNGVREPGVATLATVGKAGPSTRTVLIKGVEDGGIILTTSSLSRKGRELLADPRCSVNIYWRETLQQITINGEANVCSSKKSDFEFESRPRSARAIAIASTQSEVLQDEEALRRHVNLLLECEHLSRPDTWFAWHLVPREIEFWHGSADRFHRRLMFSKNLDGTWDNHRLQP